MPKTNYRAVAAAAARKYGIPVSVFNALVNHESSWNPNARSPVGAMGFTQLMPGTAQGMGIDPSNPVQNLYGGAKYLASQLSKFGNMRSALAAYNAGPGAVSKYGGVPPYQETQNYVNSIMSDAQQAGFGGAAGPVAQLGAVGAPAKAPQGAKALPQGPSIAQIIQQSAPSNLDTSILRQMGGTTAKIADMFANMPQIPMPRTLMQTPSGLKVQSDVQGPIHPDSGGIVKAAEQYLGTPYRWGGANPKIGFDCSGFVQWLYGQRGIQLPRTTYQQINVGKQINKPGQLKPGDIVFFSQNGDVHHEGLYIGNNQFIHSPHTGDVVKISSLSEPYYAQQFVGGRRVVGK
jgi:cell wall-associated NlpC family hydrolase